MKFTSWLVFKFLALAALPLLLAAGSTHAAALSHVADNAGSGTTHAYFQIDQSFDSGHAVEISRRQQPRRQQRRRESTGDIFRGTLNNVLRDAQRETQRQQREADRQAQAEAQRQQREAQIQAQREQRQAQMPAPTISSRQIQSNPENVARIASEGLTAYNARDFARALNLWSDAAAQGNAMAQNNLGVMLTNGTGTARNDRQAVHWYRLAANQDHADAQFHLANMYSYGRGVDAPNRNNATSWLRRAAGNGHHQAQQRVAQIDAQRASEEAALGLMTNIFFGGLTGGRTRSITFQNHTDSEIHVAVAYMDTINNIANQWRVVGWVRVGPRQSSSHMFPTRNQIMYVYAESSERNWSGSDIRLPVVDGSFNYISESSDALAAMVAGRRALEGGRNMRTVGFRKVEIVGNATTATIPFR